MHVPLLLLPASLESRERANLAPIFDIPTSQNYQENARASRMQNHSVEQPDEQVQRYANASADPLVNEDIIFYGLSLLLTIHDIPDVLHELLWADFHWQHAIPQ